MALQIRGGHIVNFGVNSLRYSRGRSYFYCSLHAEIDLIRKADGDLHGDKILVYRFNKNSPEVGHGSSRPCPLCTHALRTANPGKISYYENGTVVTAKASSLPVVNQDPVRLTERVAPSYPGSAQKTLYIEQYLSA